ncbi:hypothetical protein BKP35_03720 [Anaerobacillus arseniciselenatis]|uniref:DUF4912 domain-containing protein n=1 Tax=Anaerobacillus arseniciselenatis TaxID=85682 RepID=A0A1S2LV72_9BACI|nr:DUF4912 domain-containing protein [Anaerobacillus arseniciselenatis]OIJ16100.1 hypothetical protein BKP35_03720 [Anaerobacillus arseniciselenatis]
MKETKVDKCVLMTQSPYILYCYWEISNRKKILLEQHLNGKWNNLQKVLRLYDITAIHFNGHNAHRYVDYPLFEHCLEYFLKEVTPHRTYCVDVGVETKSGVFFSIVRSNSAATPKSLQAEVASENHSYSKWIEGQQKAPQWLEGYSSYTYYEK